MGALYNMAVHPQAKSGDPVSSILALNLCQSRESGVECVPLWLLGFKLRFLKPDTFICTLSVTK